MQQWTLQWTLFSHGFPWAGAAMAGARGWKRLEGYKLTKSACARVDLRDGHLALHVEVKQLRIVLVSGVSFCLSGNLVSSRHGSLARLGDTLNVHVCCVMAESGPNLCEVIDWIEVGIGVTFSSG